MKKYPKTTITKKKGKTVVREELDGRVATTTFTLEKGVSVLHLKLDGLLIARRYSGEKWIPLEPGYRIYGYEPGSDYSGLTIEYNPLGAQAQ